MLTEMFQVTVFRCNEGSLYQGPHTHKQENKVILIHCSWADAKHLQTMDLNLTHQKNTRRDQRFDSYKSSDQWLAQQGKFGSDKDKK